MIYVNYMYMYIFTGEKGMTVLTTCPKILFCDLKLDPGQSKTCMLIYQYYYSEDSFIQPQLSGHMFENQFNYGYLSKKLTNLAGN